MKSDKIRIGGACGFWGDAESATPQLLAGGDLDYIVYDYLAEITMSILARAKSKDPNHGYALDFVTSVLKPNLQKIAKTGVKVISNAGGVNATACGEAVREAVAELGLELKVAVVTGDDLIDRAEEIAESTPREMFADADFPARDKVQSINAYLGAFPIARALDQGADIVITGRCVDSAVTLGPCIHAFGWGAEDLDQLASGSLAGHLLECGPQATGGNFTDWETVIDGIEKIGYPIAELNPDGSFFVTKPESTGGIVNIGTVAEQMVYEIGDPQAYILPDVVCDFSGVQLTQDGDNKVQVSQAKGSPAPDSYKVCATYVDGFRGGALATFYGIDASKKAQRFGEKVIERATGILDRFKMPGFTETSMEIIGAESQFGTHRQIEESREVVLKLAGKHPHPKGVGLLLREMVSLGLATPPGLSNFAGTRPKPSPVVRLFSLTLPKSFVDIQIDLGDEANSFEDRPGKKFSSDSINRPEAPEAPADSGDDIEVPLVKLAWGRSGDKGNNANVGIIARKPEYLPYIYHQLTEDVVADRFAHFLDGDVDRFLLPGSNAINFLLHRVLGGGGIASLRNDPQGKGYAQILLTCPIRIPKAMAEELS